MPYSLSDANTMAYQIAAELKYGPDNRHDNPSTYEATWRINLLRKFRKKFTHFANLQRKGILEQVLVSVLARTFESGNCWEHAATGFTHFLKSRPKGRVEYLNINSDIYDDTHDYLILNRDPSTNLNHPESWNNGTIFLDPWSKNVFEISDTRKLSKLELARIGDVVGTEKYLHIDSLGVIDGQSITKEECTKVMEMLEELKKFTIHSGIDVFEDSSYRTRGFLSKLLTIIDQDLEAYKQSNIRLTAIAQFNTISETKADLKVEPGKVESKKVDQSVIDKSFISLINAKVGLFSSAKETKGSEQDKKPVVFHYITSPPLL